jgi:hypothetical protein
VRLAIEKLARGFILERLSFLTMTIKALEGQKSGDKGFEFVFRGGASQETHPTSLM